MLRHVDLCSGIGGFALGFQWAELSKPVLFCDIEPWSRKILAKHWPDVPIAEDVKELANDPNGLIPDCDILTAGYPCQPFSVAGQRRGTEDDRHIWPYIFSIIKAKRPSFCVFENVYGHVSMGLDEVLSDLESEAYATRPFIIPACATDAFHRRDRLWIICRNVGNTKHDGSSTTTVTGSIGKTSEHDTQGQSKTEQSKGASQSRDSGGLGEGTRAEYVGNSESKRHERRTDAEREGPESEQEQRLGIRSKSSGSSKDVAYTQSVHSNGSREHTQQSEGQVSEFGERSSEVNVANTDSEGSQGQWREHEPISRQETGHAASYSDKEIRARKNWQPEPRVGRVAHGVSNRVDRLRGLGNAIVPQISMRIGLTIKETM
tara:strand:+ start:1691 stop:2818 length:1128 start_codon:yes stop_codon:yes gene_type:complete